MTNREFYTAITTGTLTVYKGKEIVTQTAAFVDGKPIDEIVEFANTAIAKLDEKNKNRANAINKSKEKNLADAQAVVNEMEQNKVYTAKEIWQTFNLDSTQKATGLMKIAVENGLVTRIDNYTPSGKAKDKVIGYKKV